MAENVLADPALRRTSGTSSSALGYSNFTGLRENSIGFSARTLIGFTRDSVKLEASAAHPRKAPQRSVPRRFQGRGAGIDLGCNEGALRLDSLDNCRGFARIPMDSIEVYLQGNPMGFIECSGIARNAAVWLGVASFGWVRKK